MIFFKSVQIELHTVSKYSLSYILYKYIYFVKFLLCVCVKFKVYV